MSKVRKRSISATRASPKPPVSRSQILELEGHKAAVGDLNQTAMKSQSQVYSERLVTLKIGHSAIGLKRITSPNKTSLL